MKLKLDITRGVMIDLETTGIRPGCVVLSIGACTLDESLEFYRRISVEDSLSYGLEHDTSTMTWWSKQDNAVLTEAFSGEAPLLETLLEFDSWLKAVRANTIWGNGADFDQPILLGAYDAVGRTPDNWPKYGNRCWRTIKTMFEVPPIAFIDNKHNALADAKHQAKQLVATLRHSGALLTI